MKPLLCLLLAALVAGTSLSAGTITGTVRAKGAEPAAAAAGQDAYGKRKYKFVETLDYDQFRDFVISIDQVMPGAPFLPPAEPILLRQRDVTFVPHVLPILVGTTVAWPNEDEIYHNVFSMSQTKSFDLGLYHADEEPKRITFDKPGQVDVFCAIHTKMRCIVLVLENPFFALSDAKGRYRLPDVPAGTYRVRAWHERMPSQWQEITVPAEGEISLDFVLTLGGLQKY